MWETLAVFGKLYSLFAGKRTVIIGPFEIDTALNLC
jgi:hypothetical protein